MQDYYIWSIRMGAWLSLAGTGTSAISDAKTYSRNAAFAFCARQRSADGFGAIPVQVSDIKQLQEEKP